LKQLLLAAAALLSISTAASAAVTPVLDTVTPVGSEFEFSYSGTLAGDQGLMVGSTLVIFDFAGYVAGSVSAGIYAADLAATTELTSALPPPFGATDDPTLQNLVFRWTGAPFNAVGGPFADVDFAGLTARSTYSGVTLDGFTAVTVTNNGAATGFPAFNTGFVGVPLGVAVPEPTAWMLMIGGLGLAGAMVRRQRALSPA